MQGARRKMRTLTLTASVPETVASRRQVSTSTKVPERPMPAEQWTMAGPTLGDKLSDWRTASVGNMSVHSGLNWRTATIWSLTASYPGTPGRCPGRWALRSQARWCSGSVTPPESPRYSSWSSCKSGWLSMSIFTRPGIARTVLKTTS